MVDGLRVDTDALRSGAASSDGLASELAAAAFGDSAGSQPSHGGVSAMLAAVESVRGRHARRVAEQASSMCAGADRYDDTDGHAASHVVQAM